VSALDERTVAGVGPDAAPSAVREGSLVGGRRRLLAWLAVPDHLTALIVFAVALIIGAWNVEGAPPFQDDEGTYVAQAVAVQNGALAPYTYWYDHPPFGWIQLAGLLWVPQILGLGGGSDIGAMRYVSAGLFALTSMLVYLVARRIGAYRPFAILATAIFVLSPLSLTLGRQVFLDTVGMPWILLAFYLALSPRRALWHHVGAGAAFAVAVLSKLTLAVFGPALLVALLGRSRWGSRTFSVVGFLGVGGLILALFPVMALLRGELIAGEGHVSLQDGLAYQFLSRSGSGWIWEEGSSRYDLLQSWFFLDGYIVVAGLIAGLLCAFAGRTRWIPLALICFALPIVGSQGYLPAMYIVAVLPFLALAIGGAADLVWRGLMAFFRTHAPGARATGPIFATLVIAGAAVLIPIEQWIGRGIPLISADENRDWRDARDWVTENVSTDDVVVVPYSMWQDVQAAGWEDPWQVIVLEKVDLDSQFQDEHPGGWSEIGWIVEGPTVAPNIDYLGLTQAGIALENSRVVASFGAWNIREVLP
jgi:4-amino-4-deoxy-L-arabinose transferase-like glycosyltransferase